MEEEDKRRKLYTLAQSNSKDAIPYPMFKSKQDEDIHKFIMDFKDALVRNQIPRKDQVKILRGSLRNFALEIVHKDIDDVDKAYEILANQFGNSDQVFTSKYRIFLSECEQKWPSLETKPKEVFQKTTKLVSHLEELEKLVTAKSVDKGELYNASNVKKLFGVMPAIIKDKALEKVKATSTNEEKLQALKGGLEFYKDKAQQHMLLELDETVSPSAACCNSCNHQRPKAKDSRKKKSFRKCFICR